MKKIALLLCVILTAMSVLPFAVSAASWYIEENPAIEIPNAAPTVDGTINAGEGWSALGRLDEPTAGHFYQHNPLTASIDFYFASTEEGLYFAADMSDVGAAYIVKFYDADGNWTHTASYADANAQSYTFEPGGFPSKTPDGYDMLYYKVDDNTTSAPAGVVPVCAFWHTYGGNGFVAATGEDDIDNYASWNGDVIALAIDPLSAFTDEGFMASTDYTPHYDFSLFEDGKVRVGRSYSNNDGEITDECKTAGKTTDDGFCFEAMIPWDVIVADAMDMGAVMGLETEITKEACIAAGATHKAAVIFQDRFMDPEAEMVDTWGRYITVCALTPDGTNGWGVSGAELKSYGLTLVMGAAGSADTTTGDEGDDTTTAPVNNDDTTKGDDTTKKDATTTKKDATTTKKGATTTKAASTGKPSTGTSSTQTFDAGIAVAIGTLAASALGVVYSKKRK